MKKTFLNFLFLFAIISIARSQDIESELKTYVASGTDTYTFIATRPATYTTNERFLIKFTNANTGAATINRNSLGAKSIKRNGFANLASGDISAGQTFLLIYDGTNYNLVGLTATTYSLVDLVTSNLGSSMTLATSTATQQNSGTLGFKTSLWNGSTETKGWFTFRSNASITANLDQDLTLYSSTGGSPSYGTPVLTITSTGYFGIGTTTLTPDFTGSIPAITTGVGVGQIQAYRKSNVITAGTGFGFAMQNSLGTKVDYAFISTSITNNASGAHEGNLLFLVASSGTITERLRINGNGNVLISTTTDDGVNKLQINGSVSATVGAGVFNIIGSTNTEAINVIGNNTARTTILVANNNSTGNASFYFQNERGSFTSYGGLLHSGSTAPGTFFGVAKADRTVLISDGASGLGLMIGTLLAQPVIIGTADTERIRIAATGEATFLKKVTLPASVAAAASLSVPHGVAPTTPEDGNFWSTTLGFYGRVNGVTVGPFGSGITNSAAANELMKSNGTNAVGTQVFSSTPGGLVLGPGVTTAGRLIIADGTLADVAISISTKGVASLTLTGSGILLNSTNLPNRIINTDAATSTVIIATTFDGISSGTPLVGTGAGVQFKIRTDAGGTQKIGSAIETVSTNLGAGTEAFDLIFKTMTAGAAANENFRLGSNKIGFFAQTPAVRQSVNTVLVNNVTSGGTLSTIANYTDLTIYANDAAAIRNNFFRLTEKVLRLETALRNYGLVID